MFYKYIKLIDIMTSVFSEKQSVAPSWAQRRSNLLLLFFVSAHRLTSYTVGVEFKVDK